MMYMMIYDKNQETMKAVSRCYVAKSPRYLFQTRSYKCAQIFVASPIAGTKNIETNRLWG